MGTKESSDPSELRIVLVGNVTVGKTSVMNAFLRSSEENKIPDTQLQHSLLPATEECQKKEVKIGGRNVVVVDTPSMRISDEKKTDKKVMKEIKNCVELAAPGPHVFLFVLDLDRFTDDKKRRFDIIKETFGDKVLKHAIALFTHGDQLERDTIEDFIKDNDKLQTFVDECSGGCHVINNESENPSGEVEKLLDKIDEMVQKNGGECYTTEMFQEAEKERKTPVLRKRVTLFVFGFAVVGAVLGGAVSPLVGDAIGIPVGAAVGAAVGAVVGAAVIVGAEHLKALCKKTNQKTAAV